MVSVRPKPQLLAKFGFDSVTLKLYSMWPLGYLKHSAWADLISWQSVYKLSVNGRLLGLSLYLVKFIELAKT